jgi:hypothetical protein
MTTGVLDEKRKRMERGEREIKEISMLMKLMNSFNLQSNALFKDSSLVYIGFSNSLLLVMHAYMHASVHALLHTCHACVLFLCERHMMFACPSCEWL